MNLRLEVYKITILMKLEKFTKQYPACIENNFLLGWFEKVCDFTFYADWLVDLEAKVLNSLVLVKETNSCS